MSPPAVAACLGVSAVMVFGYRGIWRVVRTAVTVVHEFGHAFMVLVLGGEIRSFTVRLDTSGEVVHALPKGRLRTILVASAGYPAPSVVAALLSFCIYQSWQRWALYTMACVAALTVILWVRNLWALIVLSGFAALFFSLAYWFSQLSQNVILWILVGILGFGGLKSSFEQFIRECEAKGPEHASDAKTVGKAVFLPRRFVSFLFLVVCFASTVFAAWVVFKTMGWNVPFLDKEIPVNVTPAEPAPLNP